MNHQTRTKIVATIGPSSWDDSVVTNMINSGMAVARINASFADFAELERVFAQIRGISPNVALLLDTMGHKIRVTGFEEDKVLKKGDIVTLASEDVVTTQEVIKVTYPNLAHDLTRNVVILLDDGNITLQVEELTSELVNCKVINGGTLKRRKTVNIPGVHLNFPALSEKDAADIKFGVEHGFEFISASFVRDIYDVQLLREAMGQTETKLIAKIEDYEGVKNFDAILEVVDGIMIARGDLGVELPIERVPILQKEFVRKCREAGKPVIVATQMLESMKESNRPTRAEVSDVVNAVLDGADALMLSAETSTGQFPVESVQMMKKTIHEAELIQKPEIIDTKTDASDETDKIVMEAINVAKDLKLRGIIDLTRAGLTSTSLARHTTNVPVFSLANSPILCRQMNLSRGVRGYYISNFPTDRDESVKVAVEAIYSRGEIDLNDGMAVISGGSIMGRNAILEVLRVGDIIRQL